jgi:hypothetical protein
VSPAKAVTKRPRAKCPYCGRTVSFTVSGRPYPHKVPSTDRPCGARDYHYAEPGYTEPGTKETNEPER